MQVKYRNFTFDRLSLKLFGIVFVFSSNDSILSTIVIVESSIILAKYFPFWKLHDQHSKYNLFHIHEVFYTHININSYSSIDLNCIFHVQSTFTFP